MMKEQLHKLHIEDLHNESHPSIFDHNETYDLFIMRLPTLGKGVFAQSFGYVFTDEESFFFNPDTRSFEKLADRFHTPYKQLDKHADHLIKAFEAYKDQIVDMEESLYADETVDGFMTTWLGLKRDVLRIERILSRAKEALDDLIEHYEPLANFPINNYADLHEHIDRTMRSAVLHLSKLDYIHAFYSARTNEKMNRMIYILTILSAIFLPLNLVVGFFGMNTSGMPFAEGTRGTLFVSLFILSLMGISAFVISKWRKKVETDT